MGDLTEAEIAVVGAGPAGLAASLALVHVGADVALLGPAPPPVKSGQRDTRTAALLASSIDFLKALGTWDRLAPHAAPLKAIRIIDGSTGLLRSPELEFKASELGLDAFGYNIANDLLAAVLYERAGERLGALNAANVGRVELSADAASLSCDDGTQVKARLVVGADGRRSVCREVAGIGVNEWRYDQAAIATSFDHTRPHENISTELHRPKGSLTTVPLIEPRASSLIWVGSTEEIERLMALDALGFARALESRLEGLLGTISNVGARGRYPVAGLNADRLAGNRTALVGEAAHILPPIGAQGLNLGLRDAAALADCVAEALKHGADPGGDDVLEAYAGARKLDVMSRAVGVDLLNRSLLSDFMPLQAVRGLVSHGLNALPLLRRIVMRIGMAPPTSLPSLMRQGAANRPSSRAS